MRSKRLLRSQSEASSCTKYSPSCSASSTTNNKSQHQQLRQNSLNLDMEPQIQSLAASATSPLSSALKQNSLTGSNKSVKYRLSRIISVDDDTIEANEAAAASSTNDNSGPLKSKKMEVIVKLDYILD